MKKGNDKSVDTAKLRRQAEARLRENKMGGAAHPGAEQNLQQLVQELQIHQFELEIQNEQLQQARDEVKALLSQYTDLYDSSPVGYFTLSSDGTILAVNLTGASLLGIERSRLVNRRFGLSVSVESRPAFSTFLERMFSAGGSKETCDVTLLKNGHEPLWVHIEATISDASRGQREVCHAVVSDITERKQTEESMAALLRFQNEMLDTAAIWINTLDTEGDVTFWNRAAERISGYTRDEVLGHGKIWELLYPNPEYRTSILTKSLAIIQKGERVENFETVIRRKDGECRTISWHSNNLVEQTDRIVGSIALGADITKRKQAEEQIRKLSQAVEQSPVSVIITDFNGNIEYVNPTFTKVTGYTSEEVKGKNPRILKSGEKSSTEYQKLWKTITSGKIWYGEFFNKKKDGKLFWEKATIGPIVDKAGKITHYLAFNTDITEHKELENQLRQSQKMEAIGNLAGGVAHDFNNLLTIINGYASLLLQKFHCDDPIYDELEQIKIAGERAAKLTTQLLAFSRKQMLRIEIININDVILDMEKMLRRMISEDINLNIIYDKQLNPVKADGGQIEQIIINLAVNARDAMPQGGYLTIETHNVKITDEYIMTHPQVSPGDYAMIVVADSGIGMDKKTQDRIFEPFFTTKEKGKGTGLGLSTVYGIVKQSGGFIWVYSELDQGTSFKIYLPSVFEKIEETKIKKQIPVSYRGSETILLVEDEDAVRDLARKVLQENGYHVLDARNGGEALLIYEEYNKSVDLIITDVVMPKMSGKKLIKRLEKLKSDAKVVYISGYTDDVIVHHGILEEGINFVQKPFSPISLLKEVRRVLDQD